MVWKIMGLINKLGKINIGATGLGVLGAIVSVSGILINGWNYHYPEELKKYYSLEGKVHSGMAVAGEREKYNEMRNSHDMAVTKELGREMQENYKANLFYYMTLQGVSMVLIFAGATKEKNRLDGKV